MLVSSNAVAPEHAVYLKSYRWTNLYIFCRVLSGHWTWCRLLHAMILETKILLVTARAKTHQFFEFLNFSEFEES